MDVLFSSDSDDENIPAAAAAVRAPRHVRQRINFEVHEAYFVERFRLSSQMIDYLEQRLEHAEQNNCLSVRQQLLLCFRFLADNGFFHLTGDAHGVSKATVHRCVKRVVSAMISVLYDELVQWPNRNKINSSMEKFYDMAGKKQSIV